MKRLSPDELKRLDDDEREDYYARLIKSDTNKMLWCFGIIAAVVLYLAVFKL